MTFRDTMPDTWVASDALGRVMPTHEQVGPPKPDKFVAMFYFTWIGNHGPKQVYDLTKILAGNPKVPAYAPMGAFHWWGEPYFGYYRSDDPWVIRKHALMLADAGIDVIVCDVTNAFTYNDTVKTLFETFESLRRQGVRTPKVSFITNSHHVKTLQQLYDAWYKPGKFKEHWFLWQGKPLIMANPEGVPKEQQDFFTLRRSWAFTGKNEKKPGGWFGDGKEKWPWLDSYPQEGGWRESPKKIEAAPVAIATHPIAGVGRSHDGKSQPPEGRNDPNLGTYFQKQFDRALEIDPELIFVTGWNEWVAQRFEWGKPKVGFIGYRKPGPGESYFVDCMTEEHSRDAEPMKDGYGDNYYYQLIANVRRFKGVRAAPEAGKPLTIDMAGDFKQWDAATYKYDVDIGNTVHRDHRGFAEGVKLTNTTGRNDIAEVRVAHDDQNVYFYVRCTGAIKQPSGESRLWLMINTDGDGRNGFAGFDLLVNRRVVSDKASVERVSNTLAARGSAIPAVEMKVDGDTMHVAVPRRMLERNGKPSFAFKWADNLPAKPTAMDFIDKGDTAPSGRFAYRYQAE